jgi:carboxymethylenebutenolidase
MGEWIDVGSAADSAYLAVPLRGSGAGVLVLHAWWGLTSVFTDMCDKLASEGFVALAPSLFAGGATTATIAEAEALVAAQDHTQALRVLQAAADQLLGLPAVTSTKIAVIGFSLGAYWAFQLSQMRPNDVIAVVAVYGTDDGDYTTASAAYLGHFAEMDDFEPLEAVRALEDRIRAAGREVTFHVYPGTHHWFVEPNRPDVYNAAAAELVWERTISFLRARFE